MPAKVFLLYWKGKNHSWELASCWNCKQFLFYNHTSMWLVIFSSRACRGSFSCRVCSKPVHTSEGIKENEFVLHYCCLQQSKLPLKTQGLLFKYMFLCSIWMFANVHACVSTICPKHVCYLIWLTFLPCLLLMHPCTIIRAVSEAEEGRRGVPCCEVFTTVGYRRTTTVFRGRKQ